MTSGTFHVTCVRFPRDLSLIGVLILLARCQTQSMQTSRELDGSAEGIGIDVFSSDLSVDDTRLEERTPLMDSSESEDFNPSTDGSVVRLDAAFHDTFVPKDGFYEGSVPQVIAFSDMTCTVTASGDVYCWGLNNYLNRVGTESERERPRRVETLRQIVQFDMSVSMACGVDYNHHVWCWGENFANILQTGSVEDPLLVARRRQDITGIEQVAPYGPAFLGRHVSGVVYGRAAVPSVLVNFSLPASANYIDAEGGWCVVLSTGQVACYTSGDFTTTTPRIVDGLNNVTSIDVGGGHFCALKRDGTLWCWGRNEFGQTGIPLAASDRCFREQRSDARGTYDVYEHCVNRPQRVPDLTDVVEVSAGGGNTCVRKRDQTVWCWGNNFRPYTPDPGQGLVGDGLPNTELCPWALWDPPSFTPGGGYQCRQRPSRLMGLTGATSISVASDHTCVLLSSGQIWCWGSRATGTGSASAVPVLVPWSVMRRDE